MSEAQITSLEIGASPSSLFTGSQRTAFAFADEVLDTSGCTDDTFAAVRRSFSSREVVELLLLIGYFRMISGLMTTLDVETESPFGVRILESAARFRAV